ncbi:MAG: HD domain-containing protein [bacterium]|nr:HD domain-containing protein [bacterium]
MIYTQKIKDAINFAVKTHEVYQKQKRKGKDIPYITHPLIVGLILTGTGAKEDVIIAGILHDTIEDSVPEKKVSRDMLAERFGENVADIVESVSEKSKEFSWSERKHEALERIESFSQDSILVKSADILSNTTELVDDYARDRDKIFANFNATKEETLLHYLRAITALTKKWPESPLNEDLHKIARELQSMGAFDFMVKHHVRIIEYSEYSENMTLECPICYWAGTPKESGGIEYHDDLLDVSCPNCEKMLLVVSYPLIK